MGALARAAAEQRAHARPATQTLTRRELQVLALVADGKSNAEISGDLYVSDETVKSHLRRIFYKFGARNRAHAVAIALRAGVIA